ncbi:hypothetical protein SESBI_27490 [Sesbania bispinosa]|nr:hypothetical protein SESBI_27490 [Sesbania bispinosa]
MAPKLDKKALILEMKRKHLANAEKDKVGAGSSTVAPVTSKIVVTEVVVPSSSAAGPPKRSRSEKTPANAASKTSADKGSCSEGGLVDVFQSFTGTGANIRSLWDNQFDVGSIIDSHLTLRTDVKWIDKWGDRSAHVMLQVYDAHMAFLGRFLELKAKNDKSQNSDIGHKVIDLETQLTEYEEMKMKVVGPVERDSLKASLDAEKLKVKAAEEKYNTDFQQLNSDVARSYDLGFEHALAQAKHFNPTADVSNCDPLKELANNVLVDLGDGKEENVSAGGLNDEEVVDSQGPEAIKLTEESNRVSKEEQGNALAV